MKNVNQDRALQTPVEENRDKNINYPADEHDDTNIETGEKESPENSGRRDDADSGNDGSFDEILQTEKRIDPGNEHHHRADTDDKIFDNDIDHSPKYKADAGSEGTGSTGTEPKE